MRDLRISERRSGALADARGDHAGGRIVGIQASEVERDFAQRNPVFLPAREIGRRKLENGYRGPQNTPRNIT